MTRLQNDDSGASHPDLVMLETLAEKMDAAFRIPFLGVRVGWDSIIGLVPGLGDTAALIPAAYIIHRSWRMGASTPVLLRMGANVGIDWVIGSIPVLGDLFDVGFKGNRRNVALLRRHLETVPRQPDVASDPVLRG